MVLKPLDLSERKMLHKIAGGLSVRQKSDYDLYTETQGFVVETLGHFERCHRMQTKGWLFGAKTMLDTYDVHLTRPAWDKFSLAEWSEIEEESMREARGEDFGSW